MANGIELAPLVVDVKANVSDFNNKMDKVEEKGNSTATKASNGLKSIGDGLTNVGDKLTSHVSVPLAAVGTVGLKIGMDFESQMSRVKAISGATGDQFKVLEDQALSLGQSTAFSASECAEGMENLASAGFSTNEIVEAMPGLLDLASSSGEDLATSSEIAAGTLRGFGLEASQTAHVADVLAKNSADTNAAVSDTGEAMKYIAPVAHSMGLSLEEVTSAVGIMANANIKGSQAGTTLRTSLTRLAKPSKEARGEMEKLGFNAFDSSGKLKPLNEIVGELKESTSNLTDKQKESAIATIFGQEAMSGMLTLVDAGPQKMNELTNGLKDCDGAASEMARTMQDNTKSSIEQAFGALETASIKMLKVAAPAIKSIADKIGDLADSFSALTPETQSLILKFGLFTIAAGPVLSIVGKGVGLFTTLTPLITGAGAATASAGVAAGGASVTLGALSTVALPLVGVLAAVAGGAYLIAKDTEVMNSSCLKSSEELGGLGNTLLSLRGGYALTTDQMDKMNIKHKDWSDKISPETQKALTDVSDRVATLNFELEHANNLDGVISKEDLQSLKKRTDNFFDETIEKIKKRAPAIQKAMADAFKADDGKLDENEKKLMDFFSKSQNKQIKEVQGYQKQINDIYSKAAKEHKDITQTDLLKIQELHRKAGEVNKNNTVKNNEELKAAQADFNARMKDLDMKGLSSLLSEKAKARDKEVGIQKEKYNKMIADMEIEMPQMDAKTKNHAKKEIEEWKKLKNDAVGKEREKYQGFLDEAKKQYPQLANYINETNGEILSDKQKANIRDMGDYVKHLDGLNTVTKSGYYEIKNATGEGMHKCYVEVNEGTGKITGAWDIGQQKVYGNPIKAYEDIRKELKNGQDFQVIVDAYKRKKNNIANDPITAPKPIVPGGMFGGISSQWKEQLDYIVAHPIKAFGDWTSRNFNSSNYNGLDYVPYDGYIARLHKGERIMTADENNKYNNDSESSSTTINFNGNYGFKDRNDIDYFMNQAALKLRGAR